MGQHTLRRATGVSTSTGRAIFTGAAALALVSGGTGMAFAGVADDTSGSDHRDAKDDHDDDHEDDDHEDDDHDDEKDHDGDDHGHEEDDDEKPEACEIPIYADLIKDADALDEDLTDDALKPPNEATAAAVKPVEDAVCPIVADELNTVDDALGAGPEDDAEKLGTSPTGL